MTYPSNYGPITNICGSGECNQSIGYLMRGPGVGSGRGGGRRETEGYEEVRGMVWGKGGRIRQGWKV